MMINDTEYQSWSIAVVADSQQIGMLMVSFLESEGIEARIANDLASQYEIVGSGNMLRGAQIEVPTKDLQRAKHLIEERKRGNHQIAHEELDYWKASPEELESTMAKHTPARRERPVSPIWRHGALGVTIAGVILGIATMLNADGMNRDEERSLGAFTSAVSALLLFGVVLNTRGNRPPEES